MKPAEAAATLMPLSEKTPDREPFELKGHALQGADPELAFHVLSQRFASEPDIGIGLDKATNKLVVQVRKYHQQEYRSIAAHAWWAIQ